MLGRSSVEGNKRGLSPGNGGSREGPRDTRFRYPGQVSGPADEEICLKGYGVGWWVKGRSGCYRGQVLSTHRRAEVGGDEQSAGYSSLGSGVEGEE
jgi:hypothetical protein